MCVEKKRERERVGVDLSGCLQPPYSADAHACLQHKRVIQKKKNQRKGREGEEREGERVPERLVVSASTAMISLATVMSN